MKKFGQITTGIVTATALISSSCTVNPTTGERQLSNTIKGTVIGGIGGGILGGLIGNNRSGGRSREGAIAGALGGAAVGALIGQYMDYQAAQLRKELEGSGVSVSRDGDDIILNMPSDITFAQAQSSLQPQFKSTLNGVATIFKKNHKTKVSIIGHTDSDGSETYNQNLSENRAQSVAGYLSSSGVENSRLLIYGRGESEPIASNASASGKAQNRRVEIHIVPESEQF